MLKIKDIGLKEIKNKKFIKEIPELYDLEKCIENFPPWHHKESVYDHTISVLEELQKIFDKDNPSLQKYLNDKPYRNCSKRDLLFFMGILHDNGKPETIVLSENYTSCPNHEEVSAKKSKKILERFDLSSEEKERIIKMIASHGIFCVTQYEENPEKDYKELKNKYKDIFLDMILFEMADTKALKIDEENKNQITKMIDFYRNQIRLELFQKRLF